MIIKRKGRRPNMLLVTFRLPAGIWAETVHLVGDFNGWNRQSHPMTRTRDDASWQITLELEQGRAYQFRYLINRTDWHNDWNADRYVPNPFGGDNSIVET